ncbi:monooxygenase [Nocardia terpenica]|uniref:Monooxygenase n=1 Tax=Nocardia terpenica TaxID=455432 RepID=A0A6G9ZEQ6_9NOCA|nr:monooxygenase [Nocardia terpenica]
MLSEEPCVVVGAGPMGLTAAVAMRRWGVPVLLVEAEPQQRVRPGSRAIGIAPPVLGRYNTIMPGLGDTISRTGIPMRSGHTFYEGRRVFRTPNPKVGPFHVFGTNLPQRMVEEILLKEAVAQGVQVRWDTAVTGVETSGTGVRVELATGEAITTPYVIGADGARSVVRRAIGATLEGVTDETPFVIADVDEHPDGTTPAMPAAFHYRHPGLLGRNVLLLPFATGLRLDLECLPDDDVEYLSSPDGVREWVSMIVDPWHAEPEHVQWVSVYKFRQSVASTYTDPHRRVLLAGEAAHVFAPWGARGLNSGVFDASDAAEAIHIALRSTDPEHARQAIDRCAVRRRAWGLHNRDISGRGLRILRGNDPAMRRGRAFAARVAPYFPPAGMWLANGPIKIPVPRRRHGRWGSY